MEENSTGNTTEQKELQRVRHQQVLGGVCQGLANYFGIDTIYVRFAFVGLTMFGFFFVPIIYLALWLLLPADDEVEKSIGDRVQDNFEEVKQKLTDLFNQAKEKVSGLGLTN